MAIPNFRARKLLFGASLLVLSACGPQFKMTVPERSISNRALVAFPTHVQSYELDGFDVTSVQPEVVAQMAAVMGPEVRKIVRSNGGRGLTPEELDTADLPVVRFFNWGWRASFQIAQQQGHIANYGRVSVGDWRFDGDVGRVRDAVKMPMALFVVIRDMSQTRGRVIASVLTGSHTRWLRVGIACIADLDDGRMIWCNSRVDQWDDLSDPNVARAAVRDLLGKVYSAP